VGGGGRAVNKGRWKLVLSEDSDSADTDNGKETAGSDLEYEDAEGEVGGEVMAGANLEMDAVVNQPSGVSKRKVKKTIQLKLGVQYIINSALLFAREHIKAKGKIGNVAKYVSESVITRIAQQSPASLSMSTFPNNTFTKEELQYYASKVKSFGSSGKRSDEQTLAAAAFIEGVVNNLPEGSVQVWTDGSKLGKGSRGPAGAGVYITHTGGNKPDQKLRYTIGESTNQGGEIWAVGGALATLSESLLPPNTEIHIFSDSDFTIKCLSGHYNSKVHHLLIKQIKEIVGWFPKKAIHYHHVAGHAGIPGNDIADSLANEGARHSELSQVVIDLPHIAKTFGFNHQLISDDLNEDNL
jgi:ribonuclease HI